MNELAKILKEKIKQESCISIATYMSEALGNPKYGYYKTAEPFGKDGDFVTAPEISQMFGEMIAAFALQSWLDMGKPKDFMLVELGPGRGTLMADILKTMTVLPEFEEAVSIHAIETSQQLIDQQGKKWKGYSPTWHKDLVSLPKKPAIFIGNEFFDALPIHQIEKQDGEWSERCIGYDEEKDVFFFSNRPLKDDVLNNIPSDLIDADDGAIFEFSTASMAYMETITKHIMECGGVALVIDYGYSNYEYGDTFQAIKNHKYSDVLKSPGEADLTAHVNFQDLKCIAEKEGAKSFGPLTQKAFLENIGIVERAGILYRHATDEQKIDIEFSLKRLISEDEMGALFKVLAIANPNLEHLATFKEGD